MKGILAVGFLLYIYEDGQKELLASPESGFVGEIPTISTNASEKGRLSNGTD